MSSEMGIFMTFVFLLMIGRRTCNGYVLFMIIVLIIRLLNL